MKSLTWPGSLLALCVLATPFLTIYFSMSLGESFINPNSPFYLESRYWLKQLAIFSYGGAMFIAGIMVLSTLVDRHEKKRPVCSKTMGWYFVLVLFGAANAFFFTS